MTQIYQINSLATVTTSSLAETNVSTGNFNEETVGRANSELNG
jgi:hypothetical protein